MIDKISEKQPNNLNHVDIRSVKNFLHLRTVEDRSYRKIFIIQSAKQKITCKEFIIIQHIDSELQRIPRPYSSPAL